jgi:hypothetical protein
VDAEDAAGAEDTADADGAGALGRGVSLQARRARRRRGAMRTAPPTMNWAQQGENMQRRVTGR